MKEMKTLTIGNETFKIVDENAVRSYYSTTREELSVTLGIEGATTNDVTSAAVWGLYDALMAKYPDRVQKNEIHNDDGTFTNYEYVISTGEYNTEGKYFGWTGVNGMDTHIKKPKYLVLSGIHGNEKHPIISVYRFVRDLVEGHNLPAQFREGCVVRVLPIGNPYGLENNKRNTQNEVDPNRNFDWNFGKDQVSGNPPGDYAESEKETQAIANWLKANQDAKVFFDCHIQGSDLNEVLQIFGIQDNEKCDAAKKIVMRGVERVIPFWRDVVGYPEGTIFSSSNFIGEGGTAFGYAAEELNIPSLGIEVSAFQMGSTQEDLEEARSVITAETAAAGAEVIGNALIEFYEQPISEVIDMTETNEKMD